MTRTDELAARIADFTGRVLLHRSASVDSDEPLFSSGLVNSFGLLQILNMIEQETDARIEGYEVNDLRLDSARKLAELAISRSG
jgi:acyl carrier protein